MHLIADKSVELQIVDSLSFKSVQRLLKKHNLNEYLSNEIRNMKTLLGVKNGDSNHDAAVNLSLERKLKSWLDNSPIYLVLQWFDTVEGVNTSSKLISKRWTTEITSRDRMFLEKMGVRFPY